MATRAAETVRSVIAEAEQRAQAIVREAEAEAERIRTQARTQAERAQAQAPAQPPPAPVPAPSAPPPADDDAAARLIAMKLAMDGSSREEIVAELETRFGPADRGPLLDDVLARAGRA